jgi:hypothetical protein
MTKIPAAAIPGRAWMHGVEVALRSAVVVGIVLVVLASFGRLDLTPYGSFGAFCAVYGFNEPYRVRARTVGVAASTIFVALVAGVLLSASAAPLPLVGVVAAVVLVSAVLVNTVMGLVPAPPFFPMIALLVCAAIPTPGDEVGLRIGVAAGASILAWLMSMAGWLVRRLWPGHAAASSGLVRPFFKDLSRTPAVDLGALRDRRVWWTVGENLIGAALAYGIAVALGGERPYWAVLTVVSVIAPARAKPSGRHAVERVIGTAVGLAIVWLLLPFAMPAALAVAIIVVCQFFTQLFVVKAYAVALVFITVLVFTSLAFALPVTAPLLLERLVETAVGAAVGLLISLVYQIRGRLRG